MLSVRGKSLLSLCRDDNFVVDDETTSSSEVQSLHFHISLNDLMLFKLVHVRRQMLLQSRYLILKV